MDSKLSVSEASRFVASLGTYYDAMLRNRWYLPSIKSSLVNATYLESVRKGDIWCPKYEEIKALPCPLPPSKSILLGFLKKECEKRHREMGIDENHSPDKKWIIDLIATMLPDCEIFSKDYLPPAPDIPREDKVIDNGDKFFDSLPILTNKKSRRGRLKVYSIAKTQAKIGKLKEQKAKMDLHILKHQESLEKMNKKKVNVVEEEYSSLLREVEDMKGNAPPGNASKRGTKASKQPKTPSEKDKEEEKMEVLL